MAVLGLRIIGILNILYGVVGTCFVFFTARGFYFDRLEGFYLWPFVTMLLINGILMSLLLAAGVLLLRLHPRARVLCNWLFSLELAYFFLQLKSSDAILAFSAMANVSIVIQYFTGYPIVGLVVVNLARRGLLPATQHLEPST